MFSSIRCPKCNSDHIIVTVPVVMDMPLSMIDRLRKYMLVRKEVKLSHAIFNEATFICEDCSHMWKQIRY